MLAMVIVIAKVAIAGSAGLCLIRLLRGPDAVDRILAADSLAVHIIALLILISMELQTKVYIEAALLIALFSFLSTVATSIYVLKGKIID